MIRPSLSRKNLNPVSCVFTCKLQHRREVLLQEEAQMKKFMAVYIGTQAALERYQQSVPDPEQRKAREKAGVEAWHQWVAANGKSIVDVGAPLGKTKRIGPEGI